MTAGMMRQIREQRLGFVATVDADGAPNLSPKGTFAVVDAAMAAFAEIRSSGTLHNLAASPSLRAEERKRAGERGAEIYRWGPIDA
jgi:predicted pyridoxine 5'-phosphate oxidase superfamily flavin-nucleotide-binding protein